MPVFWRNIYHLVWATHKRDPLIETAFEEALHKFLEAKAIELGCTVHAINGMAEHVHLVLSIPPDISVSEIVQGLKGASSYHMNQFLALGNKHFAWQRGYGCLTVGERQRAFAVGYVRRQKEHHAAATTNRWLEQCGEVEVPSAPNHSSEA